MNESVPRTYILTVKYIEQLLRECEEQTSVSKDLIIDFILGIYGFESDSQLRPLAEILFSNLMLAYYIKTEIDLSSCYRSKQTGEEEILVSEAAVDALQAMALSRYYANISLNKISYSVSLH